MELGNENTLARRAAFEHGGPLKGLRVAVTGGTSGLGLALVHEFASAGSSVAFVARDRTKIDTTLTDIPGTHGIAGDVSRKEDIYPIAMEITGELGGLDVLINNASSLGPVPLALLGDTECEDLEQALATNLLGPFRLTKALLADLSQFAGIPQAKYLKYGESRAKVFTTARAGWRALLQRVVRPTTP